MTDEEKNGKSTQEQGPMSKVLGFIGFAIGMVLMFAFVPLFESQVVNFIVGAVIGVVGYVVGSWVGSLIDKK
jgi:tetrahydromethanopterin S-methyltransferase subunit C